MENRLTRGGVAAIAGAVSVTVLCLIIGFRLLPSALPEASIQLDVNRSESREVARGLLRGREYDLDRFTLASRFTYHRPTKIYLEKELGLSRADSVFSGPIRLWRWEHRWFRPGQIEEFRVAVATTGEIVAFRHAIAEDAPGDHLEEGAAVGIAERFLADVAGLDRSHLRLLSSSREQLPHRTDHRFIWELETGYQLGAPLRIEATVQGDEVGAFDIRLAVPEEWLRSYHALRSRNETASTAASVASLLLLVGVVIVFIRRISRGDIRWRPAAGFAAAAAVLTFLARLNAFQMLIFTYRTTQDLSSFLVEGFLDVVIASVGSGFLVFLLTASAEVVYRDAFPDKVSLGGFFTHRGLRTRRFLMSILVGYAMTAAFFAYQAVFYLGARRLGAWVPADVPYDDMLSTAFPWAFVLVAGFVPAVTEEFLFRVFPIPILGRVLRSRMAAVLVAAVVWGFGHSGYPNQPFYLRGIEVGLAGIVAGVVLLRLNVLALLVWHYTVDALYAAALLLRSGNLYFVLTGGATVGLLLLPLLFALAAYLRHRRFASPEGLLNRELRAVRLWQPAPPAHVPERPYRRLPTRRWVAAFALAGGLAGALHLLPAAGSPPTETVRLSAREARDRAREALEALGAPLDHLRLASWVEPRVGAASYRYGAEAEGAAAAWDVLTRSGGALAWSIRAFAPEQEEEWRVQLSADGGELIGFEHIIAEEEPRDSIPTEEARARAERFLLSRGYRLAEWTLIETREQPRPHRRDLVFTWEARGAGLILGDGATRTEIGVWGDQVGLWQRSFKVPESWMRDRSTRRPTDAARMILLGLLIVGALVHGIRMLTRVAPALDLRWRIGLGIAGVVGGLQILGLALQWESLTAAYVTSEPWQLFVTRTVLVRPVGEFVVALLLGAGLVLLGTLHPTLWTALHVRNRRRYGRDALLSGGLVALWMMVIARGDHILRAWLPGVAPRMDLLVPPGIEGRWAAVAALGSIGEGALTVALAAGLLLFLIRAGGRTRSVGIMLLAAATVALLPATARTAGEVASTWLSYAMIAVVGLGLVRTILRDNVPAYVVSCLVVGSGAVVRALLVSPVTRLDAIVVIAICALFLLGAWVRGQRVVEEAPPADLLGGGS